MATKIVSLNELRKSGDILELEFEWKISNAWVRAAELALAEYRLKAKYPQFEIIRYTWKDNGVVITVKIIQPPQPKFQEAGISGVMIAAVIFGGVVVVWLSLREVRLIVADTKEIMTTPEGRDVIKKAITAATMGTEALLLIAAAALLLFAWRKK